MKEVNGRSSSPHRGWMEDDALCGVKMLTREELPADLNPTWRTSHEKFPEAVGKAKRRVHLSPLQIISRQSVRQTAAVRALCRFEWKA